jgi:hypothetical protein
MPCGQIISTRPSKRSTVGHSRLMSAFVLAAVIRLLATFWSTRPDLNRHLQDRSLSLCPLNYAPKVATTDGFEPSLSESESDVLPLNDVATSCGRRGRSRTCDGRIRNPASAFPQRADLLGAPGELVSPSLVPTVQRPLPKRQGIKLGGPGESRTLTSWLQARHAAFIITGPRRGQHDDQSRYWVTTRLIPAFTNWRTHAESNRADRGCNSAPSRLALRPNWKETARARTYVLRPHGARRLPENRWCGQPDSNRCLDLGKVES